jgi:crotonobetainyl-CoA:carnitine CoA-transferase CaiB-like acyl-CoA transferase
MSRDGMQGDPAGALPLDGLKVLDLAWVVAGPVIGRMLADYGATVVRVESTKRVDTTRVMGPFPGGRIDTRQSALYENCNAGKLGITLDLASPGGQQVARDLAKWADVVVESFSPGQMRRWGLGYETLRESNPGLVMLSTSLMGQTGAYASFAGYGNIGAAMAGFQQLVGWPGELPIGPYGPYTDYVGPRFGIVALLAALDHRRRTGEGCHLDISQAEAGMQFLAPQIADYSVTGRVAAHEGNRDPQMAPHGVFRCRGDAPPGAIERPAPPAPGAPAPEAWVAIAARSDVEWLALAALVGGEELAGDPRFATLAQRKANEDALEAIVAGWAEQRDAAEIVESLQWLGVPAHRASSSLDMIEDPQLRGRGHFVGVAHPLMGTSWVEGSRYRLSETPGGPGRSAPMPGADNERVLRELLGYGDDEIETLRDAGVLS